MGDDLVTDVTKSLEDIAFANGVSLSQVRPIADVIVNRLRASEWSDDVIRQDLLKS